MSRIGDIAQDDLLKRYTEYATSSNSDFTGFHLGRYDKNVYIDPQGTSVINVYYDRNVHTLTFKANAYTYTPTTSNSGTQYGLVDGLGYVQLTRGGSNPNYTWTYGTGVYEYSYTVSNSTSSGIYYLSN